MPNEYASLSELKATLELNGGAGYNFADADLSAALTAASRGIDEFTRRRFWRDSTPVARYYGRTDRRFALIDDLSSAPEVEVDDEPWTLNTDYALEPVNAEADGEPWTQITALRSELPRGPRAIKVTGRFGWLAVPAQVKDATTIVAAKLVRRKREAPFGIVNVGVDGLAIRIARHDPDVTFLLEPLINWGG